MIEEYIRIFFKEHKEIKTRGLQESVPYKCRYFG